MCLWGKMSPVSSYSSILIFPKLFLRCIHVVANRYNSSSLTSLHVYLSIFMQRMLFLLLLKFLKYCNKHICQLGHLHEFLHDPYLGVELLIPFHPYSPLVLQEVWHFANWDDIKLFSIFVFIYFFMFTAEVELFIYWAFGLLLCALTIHNFVQFSLGLFFILVSDFKDWFKLWKNYLLVLCFVACLFTFLFCMSL